MQQYSILDSQPAANNHAPVNAALVELVQAWQRSQLRPPQQNSSGHTAQLSSPALFNNLLRNLMQHSTLPEIHHTTQLTNSLLP
jgi:hypothetical protein